MPTIMHQPLLFENALLLVSIYESLRTVHVVVPLFACGISLLTWLMHRTHLADAKENFTMAVVFLANVARFSNDFSSEIVERRGELRLVNSI